MLSSAYPSFELYLSGVLDFMFALPNDPLFHNLAVNLIVPSMAFICIDPPSYVLTVMRGWQ
jgi:hypothetical protein